MLETLGKKGETIVIHVASNDVPTRQKFEEATSACACAELTAKLKGLLLGSLYPQ